MHEAMICDHHWNTKNSTLSLKGLQGNKRPQCQTINGPPYEKFAGKLAGG